MPTTALLLLLLAGDEPSHSAAHRLHGVMFDVTGGGLKTVNEEERPSNERRPKTQGSHFMLPFFLLFPPLRPSPHPPRLALSPIVPSLCPALSFL